MIALTLALAGISVLTPTQPAAAHDELGPTTPTAGSTAYGPLKDVTLTFNGQLQPSPTGTIVQVVTSEGQNISDGSPTVEESTVTQALRESDATGTFTVRWRVVGSDGHPISGEYTFTVDTAPIPSPATSPSPSPSPAITSSSSSSPSERPDSVPSGGGAAFPIMALLSGVVVVGAALLIVLLLARDRRRRDRAEAQDQDQDQDQSDDDNPS